MTLPLSGIMTAGMINVELGKAATAAGTLNDTDWRDLAEVPSGLITYADFYGKTAGGGPPPPAVDIYWGFTKLLLHTDALGGASGYDDTSNFDSNATKAAGCSLSTSVKKFGAGSNYFDGTSTGYINAGYTAGRWELDSPPAWTWETWYYEESGSGHSLFSHRPVSPPATGWVLTTAGMRALINGVWSDTKISFGVASLNTWHHIAFVRDGSAIRAYVDGIQVGSLGGITAISEVGGAANLIIGGANNGNEAPFKGYMDDIRWTQGICRYTADFTPPTAAFPDTS